GRLEIDDGGATSIIADEIQSLENIRERSARTIIIRFGASSIDSDRVERLYTLLDAHRGDCGVIFEVALENGSLARIQPNQFVRVKVTPDLTNSIKEILSDCRVELVVHRAQTAGAGGQGSGVGGQGSGGRGQSL
ncbi:MAG TPA: hypothetical protein VNO14_11140, partial [Blastocatellia bacterium]|nr:hypothetical protein [Blastocatellia bacterium]